MNYSKVKSRIKTAIIILLSFIVVITCYQVWHIHFKNYMQYKSYLMCKIENNYYWKFPEEYDEWRSKVSAEFDTVHWVTKSNDFSDNQYAKSSPLFRHVVLKNCTTLDGTMIKAYAHELAHIKYQTLNDSYATYQAIITLYESNDEIFKHIAIDYANDVLTGGYKGTDYDCGYYLLEYFKETNEKIVYF